MRRHLRMRKPYPSTELAAMANTMHHSALTGLLPVGGAWATCRTSDQIATIFASNHVQNANYFS